MVLPQLALYLLPREIRRPHQICQQSREVANALFAHVMLAFLVPIPQMPGQGPLHLLLPLPNALFCPQLLFTLFLLLLSLGLPLASHLAVVAAGSPFPIGFFAMLTLLL